MNRKKLSIVIVSFNVRELLNQSLRSVQIAARELDAEIIVVDNASWDGSAAMIKTNFPEVMLITNQANIGFARANNLALKKCTGEYVVLLNPDTIVQEDTFRILMEFFQSTHGVGMAGCKILNPDGSLQLACRRSIPTPWIAFTKLVGLGKLLPKSRLFGRYNLTYLDPDEINEVEAISGSIMMTRREVIDQVGLLDEKFFMYGEDLDWCLRIRNAGFKIYYVPRTKIIHYKGSSSQRAPFDMILLFYRAMLLFVKKHFHGRYFLLPQWFLILGIGLRGVVSFIHRRIVRLKWVSVDLVFLNLSLFASILLRFESTGPLPSYLLVALIYSFVWLAAFYFFELYGHRRLDISRAMAAVAFGWMVNSTITYFGKSFAFSRAVIIMAGAFNMLLIPGWRWALVYLARKGLWQWLRNFERHYLKKRSLLVGQGKSVASLMKKISDRTQHDIEVVAALIIDSDLSALNGATDVQIFHETQKLPAYIKMTEANEVILNSDVLHYAKILGLISQSQELGVDFRIASDHSDVIIGGKSVDYLDEVSLIDIEYRLGQPSFRFLKRCLDLIISIPVIILTLPAWLFLWLKGYRLQRFPIFHSPGVQNHVAGHSQIARHELKVIVFAKAGGAVSRIQKLPILLHVVTGDLSLVGRGIDIGQNRWQNTVHPINMRPGVFSYSTLGEIAGKETDSQEKMAIYYLKNYSVLLDLKIMFRSITKRN